MPAPLHQQRQQQEQQWRQRHGAATFIRQLDIQDFALISRQRVMLMPGLNVVSVASIRSPCCSGLNDHLWSPPKEPAEIGWLPGARVRAGTGCTPSEASCKAPLQTLDTGAQVTGESGAGKSVLVQALGAVLGAPAVDGSVRPPADFASVEGVLQLSSSARVRHTPSAE